jgi:hypothetical protein
VCSAYPSPKGRVVAEGDRVGYFRLQRRADRFHTPVSFRSTRYSRIGARENPSRLADDLIDPTRPACGRPPSPKTGRDGPSL